MTCQILSDQQQLEMDYTDGSSSCGSALILRIDEFLERIHIMGEELRRFRTTSPTSPSTTSSHHSKPLVKQVIHIDFLSMETFSRIRIRIVFSKTKLPKIDKQVKILKFFF
jgi:hypothetical protein